MEEGQRFLETERGRGGIDPGSLDQAVKQLLMSDKRQPLKNDTLIGSDDTHTHTAELRATTRACVCMCVFFITKLKSFQFSPP